VEESGMARDTFSLSPSEPIVKVGKSAALTLRSHADPVQHHSDRRWAGITLALRLSRGS
jgi:hypothetical protein